MGDNRISSKFVVGDRVAVYGYPYRGGWCDGNRGIITFSSSNQAHVQLDCSDFVIVHPKQCRRLVWKKKKALEDLGKSMQEIAMRMPIEVKCCKHAVGFWITTGLPMFCIKCERKLRL